MNTRRNFIKKAGITGIASMGITNGFATAQSMNTQKSAIMKKPEVIFFDVNETLLDLTAMKTNVLEVLGNNPDLLKLWFTTMLQYSLVTTVTQSYNDFGAIGAAALVMVAANKGISLTQKEAEEIIIPPLRSLPPHPDVIAALQKLKQHNYTLVTLTNSSQKGVTTQLENAGLTQYFDERLSIDSIGKFKPHYDTYAWASRKMKVQPENSMLVAAHGWDIAGALAAGWQAAFVARSGAQLYPLAPKPQLNESSLTGIAKQLITL